MKKNKKSPKIRVTRTGRRLCLTAFLTLGFVYLLTSCNVTRKITTESSYFHQGDTTTTIVTKTIESYDASKKM